MMVELDHIGVAVRNLEESLRFYVATLGMKVEGAETVAAERVNVAMLPASAQPGGCRIELLEAADEQSVIAKFIEKRGPGLHHVALRVVDLKATLKKLEESGARLLNKPRRGAGGHLYVFVHPASTGGLLLELIQENSNDR